MKKCLLFLLLAVSSLVFAQDQQYTLTGKLDKNVQFTLVWNEYEGKVTGTYEDNFYAKKVPLRGVSGDLGRILLVTLPIETKGVRTISFLGTDLKGTKGSALVPVSVVLRDDEGKPVKTTSIEANLTGMTQTVLAQKQEEAQESCQDGFGSLAGYCGTYGGMISEEMDAYKKCNLLAFNNTRLVLDNNGEMTLNLGEVNTVMTSPAHQLGRLPMSPGNTNVDLLIRSCRPLSGTTFTGDDCKRLNLTGSFSSPASGKRFVGNYTITNEKTNQTCRYSFSLDQVI